MPTSDYQSLLLVKWHVTMWKTRGEGVYDVVNPLVLGVLIPITKIGRIDLKNFSGRLKEPTTAYCTLGYSQIQLCHRIWPRHRLKAFTFFGVGASRMALTLSGSTVIPSLMTMCFSRSPLVTPNVHFSCLSRGASGRRAPFGDHIL